MRFQPRRFLQFLASGCYSSTPNHGTLLPMAASDLKLRVRGGSILKKDSPISRSLGGLGKKKARHAL